MTVIAMARLEIQRAKVCAGSRPRLSVVVNHTHTTKIDL